MNLIEYGEKFFDELEIHILSRREVSAKAELNQISSSSASDLSMTVIRGIREGRLGISIVDSDETSRIKEGIEMAAKVARLNERDDNWPGFPDGGRYPEIESGGYELRDADHFVNLITLTLKDISERKPDAIVVGAESGAVRVKSRVMNSRGVDVSQEDYLSYFVLVLMGRHGEVVTPSIFDMDVKKSGDLDTQGVVDSCLRKLEYAKEARKAGMEEGTVVMEPFALAEILQFSLYPAFNGERKVKGTSILSERVGDRVMSEKITITDDPFHEKSISHLIADDEGTPTRRNVLVDRGVFRGFLWNHYWASITGEESTGNAVRSFRTGAVGIGTHNMVMKEGTRKVDDIIGEIDKGYLVSSFQGAHSSNPDTGSISVVANPAFVIENGEIVGSTVFMLSGNIYDLLGQVMDVSSDLKPVYMMGKGLYPHVAFENVKIAPVSR